MPTRKYINEDGLDELCSLIKDYVDNKEVQYTPLSQAQYANLPSSEKMNGSPHFVYGGLVEEPVFCISKQGVNYNYYTIGSEAIKLVSCTSLNGVVYAGVVHDLSNGTNQVFTESDYQLYSGLLNLNYDSSATQTLGGTSEVPTVSWVKGSNHDTLTVDASTNSVGIKCGYSGCYAHLFYIKTVPSDNAIYLNNVNYAGSGSGSGHTIEDNTGNEMTSRSVLQFVGGATVSDDSTNEKTVVRIPAERTLSQAAYDALPLAEKMNGTTYYIED